MHSFLFFHFTCRRVFGTILNGRSVTLTEHQTFNLWVFMKESVWVILQAANTRLHPPINDHYQPNDSSGWPGKIKMGITSRHISYFYACIETYTLMECWFWIVQRIDYSRDSTLHGFQVSTAIFGASFKSLVHPVFFPVAVFWWSWDHCVRG